MNRSLQGSRARECWHHSQSAEGRGRFWQLLPYSHPAPAEVRGKGPPSSARAPGRGYPTFADGHDAMLVCEAVALSSREQRWTEVGRRSVGVAN